MPSQNLHLPVPAAPPCGTLASTLRSLAPGARPSEVWRGAAIALLRLDTRECEALAEVFEDHSATDELRTRILDLLACAGTFEVQVTMRRLLALAVARRDSRTFATLVQRLGFVEVPDGPTLRFLMSVYAESRGETHDVRAACAYALGSAAGRALASGDPDAAVRASEVLRRDLLGATTALEKGALVTALGNAGVPSDVTLIAGLTQDAVPLVRAAAALALRKMAVPEARVQLVGLVADDEPVARSALAALAEQRLENGDMARLAELVVGGRTAPEIDGAVLRLLVAQRGLLTSSAGSAGTIEQALRMLVGRLEGQGAGAGVGAGSGERRMVSPRACESSLPPPPPPLRTSSAHAVSVAATIVAFPVPPRLPGDPAHDSPPAGRPPVAVVSGSYCIVSQVRDGERTASPDGAPRPPSLAQTQLGPFGPTIAR